MEHINSIRKPIQPVAGINSVTASPSLHDTALRSTKEMNLLYLVLPAVAIMACLASGCATKTVETKEGKRRTISTQPVYYGESSEIKVMADGDSIQEGIRLRGTPLFSLYEPGPQDFSLRVTNYFPEEVFIVTTGYHGMSVMIERSSDEESFSLPGPASGDYSATHLTLLEPSYIQEDGSVISLGFSSVGIRGSASVLQDPFIDVDLVTRATCTLTIYIRGYFRSTGREFHGSAEVPVKFTEVEPGAVVNASAAAGKPENHLHD